MASLMAATLCNSQDRQFNFDKDGLTDFVVTEAEGKTKDQLYSKAMEWISKNYKNPREVIKASIENEYIRIEGSSKTLVCLNSLGKKFYNSIYQIEIGFKDGKYKFDVIDIKSYMEDMGWTDVIISSPSPYFNKKGEVRGIFKYYPEYIPPYFNSLNNSLKGYIEGKESGINKNEW